LAEFVALLRAVNVGPRSKVAMADLRALFADLGLADARTLLQTGNVLFRAEDGLGRTEAGTLERMLEEAAARRLGVATDFLVRTAAEWRAALAANPFAEAAERDPAHLVVVALKAAPDAARAAALGDAIAGREVAAVVGRHAYIVYPDGIGRSRLTTALIERTLGCRGTGRNWNTAARLAAMAGA
jgi:uncharacterized protein (DUF1697 family)